MKIILSPAKKMVTDTDSIAPVGMPDFLDKTTKILSWMKSLEMQAKVTIGNTRNLYDYWGDLLYQSVIDDSRIIINLASKEYSKCIEKYLSPKDTYITITFCELSGEKLVTKGTYAKMARGEMVRFMAERGIENPADIQEFNRLGYRFREDLSSEKEYIFERLSAL